MVGVGEDVYAVCPPKILCFWGLVILPMGNGDPKDSVVDRKLKKIAWAVGAGFLGPRAKNVSTRRFSL